MGMICSEPLQAVSAAGDAALPFRRIPAAAPAGTAVLSNARAGTDSGTWHELPAAGDGYPEKTFCRYRTWSSRSKTAAPMKARCRSPRSAAALQPQRSRVSNRRQVCCRQWCCLSGRHAAGNFGRGQCGTGHLLRRCRGVVFRRSIDSGFRGGLRRYFTCVAVGCSSAV